MRIIDNKKDYYDYLAGVLGIDGYITYDRRNSTRLVNKTSTNIYERYPMGYGHIFCTWKNGNDPKSDYGISIYDWDKGSRYGKKQPQKNDKFEGAYNVSYDFFNIVIGSVAYIFLVYRVLQNENDKEVRIVPVLKRKFTINRSKTKSKAPILIGEVSYDRRSIPWNVWFNENERFNMIAEIGYVSPDRDGKFKENPILEGTWIPSMIPAVEVWNNITDYLLSIKEPEIIDKRNDIQHLESHGFDKKTSFRNVK